MAGEPRPLGHIPGSQLETWVLLSGAEDTAPQEPSSAIHPEASPGAEQL